MAEMQCAVGRRLTHASPYEGLDWINPCRLQPQAQLPFDPPLAFCDPHFAILTQDLPHWVERHGMGYVLLS